MRAPADVNRVGRHPTTRASPAPSVLATRALLFSENRASWRAGRILAAAHLAAGELWQDHGLVFTGSTGKPLDDASVRRSFRALCEKAGIGGSWSPRELGHTFVSLMSESGIAAEEIARLAGDSGSRTIEVVFRHELRPVITTGADAMDKMFRWPFACPNRGSRRAARLDLQHGDVLGQGLGRDEPGQPGEIARPLDPHIVEGRTVADMFTIGEFARLGDISIRMLRHFDEIGLLAPAQVDPATGYRSYSIAQLRDLNRIVALRGLGFSLTEARQLLAGITAVELRGMLLVRQAELERQIEVGRSAFPQHAGT